MISPDAPLWRSMLPEWALAQYDRANPSVSSRIILSQGSSVDAAAPEVKQVNVGLLGADYAIDHDRYRFAKVYFGENWNPGLRAPLTEPGVNVHEGEYLFAVDGREVHGSDEIYSFFLERAGKAVQLKVGPDPSGKDTRTVTVVPIANEHSLRQREWMEGNRKKVDELSGGKLSYGYVPDTSVNGFTYFNRYYFAQNEK